MKIDDIGKFFRTNDTDINPERVRARFRNFSITMLWGLLERKPYQPASERYQRARALIHKFSRAGLNVPELTSEHDEELTLEWKTFELTDLVEIFEDPRIHLHDKYGYLREAFRLLQGIHNLGETHGDTYLKNFYRLNAVPPGRTNVYTCGFEYRRDSPRPELTDVMILAADAIYLLKNHDPSTGFGALQVLEEVYGRLSGFPFDLRDRLFYRMRFGMNQHFFEYFGPRIIIS